jgi:hypothetical protein
MGHQFHMVRLTGLGACSAAAVGKSYCNIWGGVVTVLKAIHKFGDIKPGDCLKAWEGMELGYSDCSKADPTNWSLWGRYYFRLCLWTA